MIKIDFSDLAAVLTDTPQTKAALARLLGITERQVRRKIAAMRDAGYPVASCSQSAGYYLAEPGSPELAHTVADLRSRAVDMLKRARALELGPDSGDQLDMGL